MLLCRTRVPLQSHPGPFCAGRERKNGSRSRNHSLFPSQSRVEDLLVQRLTGRDHGEDVLMRLHEAFKEHRSRVVVLDELLHLRRELFQRLRSYSVDAHRFREENEVRVLHGRVRVTVVVEHV